MDIFGAMGLDEWVKCVAIGASWAVTAACALMALAGVAAGFSKVPTES